jgi:hypothetical protein
VWETKYQDTHVFTPEWIAERLRFMHEQPVKAGLVVSAAESGVEQCRNRSAEDG